MKPLPQSAALNSALVADDTPVLPGYAIQTPRGKHVPVFGDDVWDLSQFRHIRNRSLSRFRLDFRSFTDPVRRLVAKEYMYARFNARRSPVRGRLTVGGAYLELYHLRHFLTFLDTTFAGMKLADVTQEVLNAYLAQCQLRKDGTPKRPTVIALFASIPIKLAVFSEFLSVDQLSIRPWEGESAGSVAGVTPQSENRTPCIPDAVLNPLVSWAWFYVETAANDILNGLQELEEYGKPVVRDGHLKERLQAWLAARRAQGRGIPAHEGGTPSNKPRQCDAYPEIHDVYLTLIEKMARVPHSTLDMRHPATFALLQDAVRELGLEPGGMDTPISIHPATGSPWRGRFSPESLKVEKRMLIAACYIICAYLSGMRDSEVISLRRGCHFTATSADGVAVRHKVRGTVYKGQGGRSREATWVVIEPVARAIRVLERLTDADHLFSRSDGRSSPAGDSGTMRSNKLIKDFIRHLNATQAHDRQMVIPDIDGEPWPLNTSQFRRTLARHIACQPFGTVAGKIQYKHVSVVTFEGYAGRSGFRNEVEAEQALYQTESIMDAYEEHINGVRSIGPGARRVHAFFDSIQEELGDFPGHIADRARLRNLLQLRGRDLYPLILNLCIFDPSVALCVQNAHADKPNMPQCDPHRCPNSCITEKHLPAWKLYISSSEEYLKNRKLPVLQRVVIEQKVEQYKKVIAPLEKKADADQTGDGT